MTDENQEYELLMPFVVCETQGGPYQDKAFVAGYTAGMIDATLKRMEDLPPEVTSAVMKRYVPPALVPQLDLIAMQRGVLLTTEPWDEHPGEWALATFTLRDTEGDGEQP